MSKIDEIVTLVVASLKKASDSLDSNEFYQLGAGIKDLSELVKLLAGTINVDNGSVLKGYEDANAEIRASINTVVSGLVGIPVAAAVSVGGCGWIGPRWQCSRCCRGCTGGCVRS